MKNKIIGLFVCILLITNSIISVCGTENERSTTKSSTFEIPDGHIILNVPYVNQGKSLYCIYASITMIFQYYGINTSLLEVCYNSGVGYSLGYKIRYPCLCIPGALMSQEAADRQFLAEIYGLNYSYWNVNDNWQLYWTFVKENISQNIPVTTEILMQNLPYYKNISGNKAHTILLVGYNETNNTVCVHDSAATVVNHSMTSGAYIYIPIDSLKKALNLFNKKYLFEIFKLTINQPLTKKEAFELAHSRNIKRMKGDAKAYDKEFIRSKLGALTHIFGVHVLKYLKHSYNFRNIFFLKITDKITKTNFIKELARWSYLIHYEKRNMSQYLTENVDLHPTAFFDANMLEIEAHNWLLLNLTFIKLSSISIFRLPTIIVTVEEIRNILDVISFIENNIIAGSPKAM